PRTAISTDLPPVPTRRSSDLVRKVIWPTLNGVSGILPLAGSPAALTIRVPPTRPAAANPAPPTATPRLLRKPRRLALGVFSIERDRKRTRLNSSHGSISYAVF